MNANFIIVVRLRVNFFFSIKRSQITRHDITSRWTFSFCKSSLRFVCMYHIFISLTSERAVVRQMYQARLEAATPTSTFLFLLRKCKNNLWKASKKPTTKKTFMLLQRSLFYVENVPFSLFFCIAAYATRFSHVESTWWSFADTRKKKHLELFAGVRISNKSTGRNLGGTRDDFEFKKKYL